MQAYFGKQTHFDQASAIMDSYWEGAWGLETKMSHMEQGLGSVRGVTCWPCRLYVFLMLHGTGSWLVFLSFTKSIVEL